MKKRLQFFIILAVTLLTIYNILPTIFYYTKPLKKEISKTQAASIEKDVLVRVNKLEKKNLKWLDSYFSLLNIKPSSIENLDGAKIKIKFTKANDAATLKKFLPRAQNLLSNAEERFTLEKTDEPNSVTVKKTVPYHFDTNNLASYFHFDYKLKKDGATLLYKQVVFDRLATSTLR